MQHPPHDACLEMIFSKEQIAARIAKMAVEIDSVYNCEPLVAVCVLKGAFIFFGDLVRSLRNPLLELDFVRLSSYGNKMTSTRHLIFNKDVEVDLRAKHVLIVEDIVDSGQSMQFLLNQFAPRNPLSLRIAALVDKKERRETGVHIDFTGFRLPGGFIVGYGMDYAEKYRALPDIMEIKNPHE